LQESGIISKARLEMNVEKHIVSILQKLKITVIKAISPYPGSKGKSGKKIVFCSKSSPNNLLEYHSAAFNHYV
jgi:hypothetical protein